ncbi:MAG: DNA polymerase III subunit gamma/tau, partial [Planctomycetes bacterium]|nr:DNA polymerase III subunit gamma/tau [Planctomycetota bacterium]
MDESKSTKKKRYLVLARKYRPQTFDDIIGQEHIVRTLKNAIAQNRIHHFYLFTGSRGIGKTSTARVLAKAINCVEGPTDEPCGKCHVCKQIEEGKGGEILALYEIDGASNRGVDDIRELRKTIRQKVGVRFRVIIIDEVHMLTQEAFNALLKTLEEPPEHVKFIFATTEAHKVPETIISRCQRLDFRRISINEIAAHLRQICELENIDAEDEAL